MVPAGCKWMLSCAIHWKGNTIALFAVLNALNLIELQGMEAGLIAFFLFADGGNELMFPVSIINSSKTPYIPHSPLLLFSHTPLINIIKLIPINYHLTTQTPHFYFPFKTKQEKRNKVEELIENWRNISQALYFFGAKSVIQKPKMKLKKCQKLGTASVKGGIVLNERRPNTCNVVSI